MIKKINNDFNLYKNFYFVAKTGSFTNASKELYLSQPTISYNVKCLEENLGCKLFIRTSKGIELTDNGKSVLENIENAYNSILLAERSITNNKLLNAGTLNIGGPSFILNKFISPLICSFSQKYPQLKINIITKSSPELLNLLKTNKLDILIDTLPFTNLTEDISIKTLWQKETCFAGKQELVKNINVNESPVFLFPEIRSDIGKYLLQEFILQNWYPKIKMQITSTETMLTLSKQGVGIGYFMKDYINDELLEGKLCETPKFCDYPTINIACLYIDNFLNYAAKEFLAELDKFVIK